MPNFTSLTTDALVLLQLKLKVTFVNEASLVTQLLDAVKDRVLVVGTFLRSYPTMDES
jgi:hypothetical protein